MVCALGLPLSIYRRGAICSPLSLFPYRLIEFPPRIQFLNCPVWCLLEHEEMYVITQKLSRPSIAALLPFLSFPSSNLNCPSTGILQLFDSLPFLLKCPRGRDLEPALTEHSLSSAIIPPSRPYARGLLVLPSFCQVCRFLVFFFSYDRSVVLAYSPFPMPPFIPNSLACGSTRLAFCHALFPPCTRSLPKVDVAALFSRSFTTLFFFVVRGTPAFVPRFLPPFFLA